MAQTYDPVAKLNELIRGMEFAMLTTVRTDGSLHSCPMAAAEVDRDGILWFFSRNKTEKVEAIKNDRRVNLSYSDPASQRYVSITGDAEPLRNHVKAQQLWDPRYGPWFANGVHDPDLILLRVVVGAAEYWDESSGGMVPLSGFPR